MIPTLRISGIYASAIKVRGSSKGIALQIVQRDRGTDGDSEKKMIPTLSISGIYASVSDELL
jgi:hypothetical protein